MLEPLGDLFDQGVRVALSAVCLTLDPSPTSSNDHVVHPTGERLSPRDVPIPLLGFRS